MRTERLISRSHKSFFSSDAAHLFLCIYFFIYLLFVYFLFVFFFTLLFAVCLTDVYITLYLQ